MAADNRQQDSIAAAITQVSENLTRLVHDEVELAKAEVKHKGLSLLRGGGAVAAGAGFGIFAVVTGLITIGWALDAILVNGVGEIWLGFLIVTVVLLVTHRSEPLALADAIVRIEGGMVTVEDGPMRIRRP